MCAVKSQLRFLVTVKSMIYSNKEYSVFGNMCKTTDGDNPRSILGFASSDRTRRTSLQAAPARVYSSSPWSADTGEGGVRNGGRLQLHAPRRAARVGLRLGRRRRPVWRPARRLRERAVIVISCTEPPAAEPGRRRPRGQRVRAPANSPRTASALAAPPRSLTRSCLSRPS